MVKAEDVAVNVLTSTVTTLIIIFLLIPFLKIPVPAIKEIETITEKKYYYPYVMPVELEGDYSDWTIYDSFIDADLALTYPYLGFAIFNKDETEALLISYQEGKIKRYTIATKELSGLLITDMAYYWDGLTGKAFKSVLGTYVVIFWSSTGRITEPDRVSILKNGITIKTFTAVDLGIPTGEVYAVSISPSGKYIVVAGGESEHHWVVLAGS